MDQEELLKKWLKCHREYKKKMEMGKQIYEFIKEYVVDELLAHDEQVVAVDNLACKIGWLVSMFISLMYF